MQSTVVAAAFMGGIYRFSKATYLHSVFLLEETLVLVMGSPMPLLPYHCMEIALVAYATEIVTAELIF